MLNFLATTLSTYNKKKRRGCGISPRDTRSIILPSLALFTLRGNGSGGDCDVTLSQDAILPSDKHAFGYIHLLYSRIPQKFESLYFLSLFSDAAGFNQIFLRQRQSRKEIFNLKILASLFSTLYSINQIIDTLRSMILTYHNSI